MKERRKNSFLKKISCLVLAAMMMEPVSACRSKQAANRTDFSQLSMPKGLDFQFNTTSFEKNGAVGSHDPCLIRDPKSKMYYSYSTDNSVDKNHPGIGIQIRKSSDLQHWTYVGIALSEKAIAQAQDNGEGNSITETFWAPDVEYVDGEFRMYYAATKAFGSNESRIWLAVSKKPEGPFGNKGIIVSSWPDGINPEADVPNAIDPYVIRTPEGKTYLSYGSYFAGIYLKELRSNGFAVNQNRLSKDYFGICIAKKGDGSLDGPEGSSLLYNKSEGYYYLFLSYGWLGDTYDIRVGRSKKITGPYVDDRDRSMTASVPGITTGTKLACSYQFHASKPGGKQNNPNSLWSWGGFRAPGGGVPFSSGGQYFFAHHIRDGASINHTESGGQSNYFMHYLMIRKMYFVNGWPVLSPEPYAGEIDETIQSNYLPGQWEAILFADDNNDPKMSQTLDLGTLTPNGKGTLKLADKKGSWSYQSKTNILTLQIQSPEPVTIRAKVSTCWDLENSRATICFTGLTSTGTAVWGKCIN